MPLPQRKLGNTGLEVSPLGFGCMRLPTNSDDKSDIDLPLAVAMVRQAVDAGVNYVDTAWPYHSSNFPQPGESEPFLAQALRDGYRDKVHLATKLPLWAVDSHADLHTFLDAQLKRLDTRRIDVYLIHNINAARWPKVRDHKIVSFLEEAVKDGRIGTFGFSFHDNLNLFREIMDSYDWPVAQIQYNYLDTAYQAGEDGLRYAAAKGTAVVVMEPLRGGFLINRVPGSLRDMLKEVRPDWSLADWALRWVMAQPEVGTVLSGMSTMEQVEENLRIAASPADFGETERKALGKVREWFIARMPVNCTACGYCLPCPVGIGIPDVFTYYNESHLSESADMQNRTRVMYQNALPEGRRAKDCVACRQCESRCPQNIAIADTMKTVSSVFDAAK